MVVHDDVEWLERHVRELTEKFERSWSVDDASAGYVDGLLKAIIGVELVVSRIEAKAKLSQNRFDADIAGVIAGLESAGAAQAAQAVRDAQDQRSTGCEL